METQLLELMSERARQRVLALAVGLQWAPRPTPAVIDWPAVFAAADQAGSYVFGPSPGAQDSATVAPAGETASAPVVTRRGRKPGGAKAAAAKLPTKATAEPKRRGRKPLQATPAQPAITESTTTEPKRIGRPPKQGEFTAEQIRMARAIVNAGASNNVLLGQKMGLTPDVAKRLWKAVTEAE